MEEQFDITDFAKMFDAALVSDVPGVQKALRNFMMVAAIVHSQDQTEERQMGPLETLVKKVSDLERMVYELQNNRTYKDNHYGGTDRDYRKEYYGSYPTWVYNPNTSICTTSGTSSTSTLTSIDDISTILKDLKFT